MLSVWQTAQAKATVHAWAKRIKQDLERTTMRLENLLTLKRE